MKTIGEVAKFIRLKSKKSKVLPTHDYKFLGKRI